MNGSKILRDLIKQAKRMTKQEYLDLYAESRMDIKEIRRKEEEAGWYSHVETG